MAKGGVVSSDPSITPTGHADQLFVLRSGVRSGLKREFAFALKAQAELSISPIGRTRSGKIRRSSSNDGFHVSTRKSVSCVEKKSKVSRLFLAESTDVEKETTLANGKVNVDFSGDKLVGMDVAVSGGVKKLNVYKRCVGSVRRHASLRTGRGDVVLGVEALVKEKMSDVSNTDAELKERKVSSRLRPRITAEGGFVQTPFPIDHLDNETQVTSIEICDVQNDVKCSSGTMEVATIESLNGLCEEKRHVGIVEMESPKTQNSPICLSENISPTFPNDQREDDRPVPLAEVSSTSFPNDRQDVEGPVQSPTVLSASIPNDQQDVERPVPIPGISFTSLPSDKCDQNKPDSCPEVFSLGTTVNDEEHVKPEKPFRRFTRSVLKSTGKELTPYLESDSDRFDDVRDSKNSMDNVASGQLRKTLKKKMELKMSKKIALTKLPATVRDLFATGLLDGLTVKYIGSNKQKLGPLTGVIKDGGILCSCSSCKGKLVVSAYQFELHSGSTKKHPSDYIYFDNGKNIRDILRVCTTAPLDMFESAIQNAIPSVTDNKVSKCQGCNDPLCDSCTGERTPVQNSSSIPHKSVWTKKSSLCSNISDSSSKNVVSQKKSGQGRVTTKDTWLHKLVFMDDTLLDGTEVAYYARGQRLLEGYIKGAGIFCSCCSTVVSPSQFEAHAGWAKRRKPYLNIYTSNGVSLHELSVSLSKGRKFTARENDTLCRMCSKGGDLILCDLCPRAFHKECVGLSITPKGDWYCPCCEAMHHRENYVAHNNNAIAAGRVSGIDPIEQIFKRCIRIVQSHDADASSCVLCRCHDFSKSGFGPRTVLLCDQCEKEFHIGCLKERKMADLKELPKGKWFCCSGCSETHIALQKCILSGSHPLPDMLLESIKRKHIEKGLHIEPKFDVRCTLINGKVASPDSRLLLEKAVSIFHETFDPILDLFTQEDLIPAMVYGNDVKEQDFGGMYCAVLTVNSSVVSAGILRVFGCDVAELPLVATTMESQGLGYFQSLFSYMVTLLESMNVKNLVLPATKEAVAIWLNKFDFREITMKQLEEYTKGARTMNFQGTPMLHKQLLKS